MAVAMAVSAFKTKQVEKIILTRPAVEAGESLGFLPGDLQSKVDPYLRPLYDALQEMFGLDTYQKLMERGVIEIAPLAYMRGRTLNNAFIILDLPKGKKSGLMHATSILKNIDGIGIVRLTAKDVVRHSLVMQIIKAYSKSEERE